MAAFPTSEAEIVALALSIKQGLLDNPAVFPDSPVSAATLGLQIGSYQTAKSQQVNAEAALKMVVTVKNGTVETLVGLMRQILRYAENATNYNDAQLALLGWGGPAAPVPLAPPGQPRLLEAPRQGEGWIFLDWKAPTEGGAAAVYKIERRLRPDGAWLNVGLAMETEATLTAQDRNKEWEYRVTAVNKAGDSLPSNTVMAVL